MFAGEERLGEALAVADAADTPRFRRA